MLSDQNLMRRLVHHDIALIRQNIQISRSRSGTQHVAAQSGCEKHNRAGQSFSEQCGTRIKACTSCLSDRQRGRTC